MPARRSRWPVDSVELTLEWEVPFECIADVNGDGMLSPADFSAWVSAFNTAARVVIRTATGCARRRTSRPGSATTTPAARELALGRGHMGLRAG